MKLRGGEWEHQAGNPRCNVCDAGWPQRHSEAVEHCCPGWIHAETVLGEDGVTPSKVLYYCDVCYEDDPF